MTSRSGTPWTAQEMADVLQLVSETKSMEDIATAQQRTANSIRFKLTSYACAQVKEGKSVEELATLTGLSVDGINAAVLERSQPRPKPVKAVVVKKAVNATTEINDILNDLNKLQGRLARFVAMANKALPVSTAQ